MLHNWTVPFRVLRNSVGVLITALWAIGLLIGAASSSVQAFAFTALLLVMMCAVPIGLGITSHPLVRISILIAAICGFYFVGQALGF
jgi:hypothetical protein